jgi:hypothetical protein
MAKFKWYDRHPHKYAGEILLPPVVFFEMVRDALILSADTLGKLPTIGLNPAVPRFLAAEHKDLAEPFPSITRWSFLRRRDGGLQLLEPQILDRELPSALHWGLVQTLDAHELGEYNRRSGTAFEEVVARRISRHWPEVVTRPNVRQDAQSPEIDLLLELAGRGLVLVQCKARPLSPKGRWGANRAFYLDMERTILRAALQARACENAFGTNRVVANLIVLEAYFPAISLQAVLQGTIGQALQGLVRPLVINYFDLDYMLAKVSSAALEEYLNWREERLRLQTTIPIDEFDMVRAFLIRHEARWDVGENKQVHVTIIGDDKDYQKACLEEADNMLAFDREKDLLLGPPPTYLRVFTEKGREAADALIPSLRDARPSRDDRERS